MFNTELNIEIKCFVLLFRTLYEIYVIFPFHSLSNTLIIYLAKFDNLLIYDT